MKSIKKLCGQKERIIRNSNKRKFFLYLLILRYNVRLTNIRRSKRLSNIFDSSRLS